MRSIGSGSEGKLIILPGVNNCSKKTNYTMLKLLVQNRVKYGYSNGVRYESSELLS